MMLALFGFFACWHFDASIYWWLVGFLCVLLEA
jgi:hypothetical protein